MTDSIAAPAIADPPWSRTQVVLAVLAVWTALTLLSVGQAALTMPPNAGPVPWGSLILGRFADWYTCLLFAPAFVWLSHRYPVTETGWVKSISLLFVASAIFVVLKYLIFLPIARALSGRGDMTFVRMLASNALLELIIFWAIIAVIQAFDFRRRLREQEHNAVALRARLAEAQLDALSAQLQPHFLFNTLSAVGTLMHRDAAAADLMITRLGALLRTTLAAGAAHEVTLADEVVFLERYLDIMRIRFSDRLTITVEVPEATRLALVPRLLLQPLVENAFEHGIARRTGPGAVRISATRTGETLRLAVIDDGPGVAAASSNGEGVGLANSRARLRQLYGERQRLTLSARDGGSGTEVAVEIPWHTEATHRAPAPIA